MSHSARHIARALLFAVTFALSPLAAGAADIVTEWGSVKAPPVPQLKPVAVDPKTTALLVLDFMKNDCGARPRCVATVPTVKKLIDAARANGMMISYNLPGETPKPQDMVDQSLAPRPGEHLIKNGRGANKFYNSDLEQALKAKGITTVIITGTSAQGAVAGSTQGAAERGFKVIVPVDGMSAEDAYNEQYAAWHLAKGGPVALVENVTLTRSDLIKSGTEEEGLARQAAMTDPTGGGIIGEWASVKLPPVPELKPTMVDPGTTALLVLDMMKGNCGVRPRCLATVATIRKLIDAARANHVMLVYNLTGAGKVGDMVDQSLAPRAGDFMIKGSGGADKFVNSNLDQGLKDRGIKTVIVAGTSAQGAVCGTTNGAAQRGYKAVVLVDCMSAEDTFNELYAAYHIAKGGPVNLTSNATLTRSDMISFGQ